MSLFEMRLTVKLLTMQAAKVPVFPLLKSVKMAAYQAISESGRLDGNPLAFQYAGQDMFKAGAWLIAMSSSPITVQ